MHCSTPNNNESAMTFTRQDNETTYKQIKKQSNTQTFVKNFLKFDSVFSGSKMSFLLLLLQSLLTLFKSGQSSTNSTGLFVSQVQRNIFLSSKQDSELFSTCMGDDGVDSGNRFLDSSAIVGWVFR